MNQRIEKLFEQALEEFKAENKYATIVDPDPLQRDFVEKFAELIVRECILISRTSTDGFSAGRSMEKHFGIQE